jgi:RimJ/RimL family protein N-acetyltransferase
MSNTVLLRDITEGDLKIFLEQECDPIANLMAAYPARNVEDFLGHWRTKILGDDKVFKKTIIFNESVAGNIVCWEQDGKRLVGYWIGRNYWGNGIATAALSEFLMHFNMRPLHAYVAKHNLGSIRVLEKSGFTVLHHGTFFSEVHDQDIEETLFIYN